MSVNDFLPIILITTTFFCSLVAGFLFSFGLIVMPGIGKLNNREFIRSFQEIDGIIQNNQPVFVFVWLGSILLLLATTALGIRQFQGLDTLLLIAATVLYLFGVQLPTFTINVPLNNQLQAVKANELDQSQLKAARLVFEDRWNRWNTIRTLIACLTAILLMILLLDVT